MKFLIEVCMAGLLLLLSAFFAAAETALVSLSAQKIKQLALRNPSMTPLLLGWLAKPHELIIVILAGNTLSVILFATFVTSMALNIFWGIQPPTVEMVSWLAQTVVVVIIGETTPKFFARLHPESTSLFVLPWLARIRFLFNPFMPLLARAIALLTPFHSTPPVSQLLTFSMEELRSLLDEDQIGADGKKESLTMMQRVIEINDKTVRSIMTPSANMDVMELDLDGKIKRDRDFLLDLIIEKGHSRTPILKQGAYIGYIHTHDLLQLILDDQNQPLEKFAMPMLDISADMQVSDLLQRFKMSDIHIGMVHDSSQEVLGLVTMEDVLEEITGEILDEYDVLQTQEITPP